MQSLVGLKAMDVQRELLQGGYFELGNYNKAIALVIPAIKTREELVNIFRKLEKYLNEKETE